MDSFLKLLQFLGGSPLAAFLIVVGVLGLALGSLGKYGDKIKLDEHGRHWSRLGGAVLLLLGLAIDLTKYLQDRELTSRQIIVDYLPVLLIGLVALLAAITELKLRKRLKELKEAEEHLVSSVEDATRHVLKGIPQIFDRAYQLVKQADKELWVISFAMDFGECHAHIPAVTSAYNKMPVTEAYRTNTKRRKRNMKEDVKDLAETLKTKVVTIPSVHILTLCDEDIKGSFLAPLAGRPKYKETFTSSKVDEIYGLVQQAKRKVMDRIKARDPSPNEEEQYAGRMLEVHRLPIQLVIAGIKGQDRFGCLVFMVGTEILLGAKRAEENGLADDSDDDQSFYEPGFYTELKEVVDVYKSLANALFSEAKNQCDVEKRVAAYVGK